MAIRFSLKILSNFFYGVDNVLVLSKMIDIKKLTKQTNI